MRVSQVEEVNVHSLSFSSHFTIGDSANINAFSKALAVKREFPRFYGREGNFLAYSLFTRPIPKPVITENVCLNVTNNNRNIHVQKVDISGISFSSVFQIGSNKTTNAEARIKHIRQLLGNGNDKEADEE
ncbi:spore germination protein GerPE [Bacillus alkalisoli]|uniref:spore germination protein GerPE n=1 Tax=Bacillus alkalisoli TaxID=2011008 RepID=UPI000C24E537|nr:spore germination protein GerPE [Bacillus alkalisoli]